VRGRSARSFYKNNPTNPRGPLAIGADPSTRRSETTVRRSGCASRLCGRPSFSAPTSRGPASRCARTTWRSSGCCFGRGSREAGAVAVAIGGVRIRGTDAPRGVKPRGGHDVTHLNTRGRRGGDTRRGTLSCVAQLVGRVAVTAGDQGGTPRPPDACRAPRGAGGGRTVQGGPRGDGQQRSRGSARTRTACW